MSADVDPLTEQDRERAREGAAGFWASSLVLTVALLAAFPPTQALGATAGWLVGASFAVATVAYIVRLKRLALELGERELWVASILAAAALGVDQWLAGGFGAPLSFMFTLQILGGAAGLQGRQRATHLVAVAAATAAPLAYDGLTAQHAVTVLVFVAVFGLESLLLADFGRRLREQRRALHEAEQHASRLAVVDPLTGLGNRRALGAALADGGARAVVYLDLNGFKDYNDRFGHGAGDALLERVGHALTACLGGRGHGFRVGGDEFCVLLDATGAELEDAVGDVVAALSDHEIRPAHGVVVMPQEASDGESALRLADERMYAAKRAQRAAETRRAA